MQNRTICAIGVMVCGFAGVAAAQEQRRLTPRELFYAAPAAPAPATTGRPKTAKQAQVPPAKTSSIERPKAQAPPEPPRRDLQVESTAAVPVNTTYVPAPLGLRYSILKREGSLMAETDPETVFHSGDRIRLGVEVNSAGYLYVVNRGSSGTWKVLFPSPEVDQGSNAVERGRRYEIPAGFTFTFDDQPGVEKLFLVFARRPVPDLESLIYSLRDRTAPAPAAPAPAAEPREKLLLAKNVRPIDDALIGRLRNAYARDLIIEKVDEGSPGPKKEKAVYAVNPSAGVEGRVVADVSLNHR